MDFFFSKKQNVGLIQKCWKLGQMQILIIFHIRRDILMKKIKKRLRSKKIQNGH
jgi:hypothetical protein